MAVFLFYGEDAYSTREKLKFWRKEFEKKYGGEMNITVYDGKETTANEIFQACCAMPFLSEKRLTVVKNFLKSANEKEQSHLAESLEKIPDFCVLVFSENETPDRRTALFKKIQKHGKIMEFPALTGGKLLAWIQTQMEKRGATIEKDALIYLSDVVGGDLFQLENEIEKLAHYAANRPITKADIDMLVNTQLTTSIFRLTDGIGHKNAAGALATLHNLIETGEELPRILYMIMRQFRIITCVKDLSEQGLRTSEITTRLKEHPFVISNTLIQARNFTIAQLRRAYELLINIDAKIKSGGIRVFARDNREFVLALDRLVLDLCAN